MTTDSGLTLVAESELPTVEGGTASTGDVIWSGTAKSDIQKFLETLDHAINAAKKM
jgi:hypothetical protein